MFVKKTLVQYHYLKVVSITDLNVSFTNTHKKAFCFNFNVEKYEILVF